MKLYQGFYSVIRFIPDLLKDEPINIGLIIHSPKENYIRTEFSHNKIKLISKYNSNVDPMAIKYLTEDIKINFNKENFILKNHNTGKFSDNKLLFKVFSAHSNQLQFTEPRAILTDDLDKEFERLFTELVFKHKQLENKNVIEERNMRSDLKKMFNEYNLINTRIIKENHIEIDRFGSEIKIDFKYLNGKEQLIKNISLEPKNKEPMDLAKLWLKNYEEIKSKAKIEKVDKNIQVIYCLPSDDRSKINNSILSCLEEASDQLIDFRDKEKIDYFVKNVSIIAHN